jgi:hypothetical protein
MAQYDVFLWRRDLAELLPGGNATIVQDLANPGRFTVTITWNERTEAKTLVSEVQF